MKILKLRLRNMIGIKKGLGLDDLDLDLSQISGLCALSGENGAGKTSVLESLQIFPRLASRKGSLQGHYYGRDGLRELEFSFQDNKYKVLIKVDSEANRAEGYAWKNGVSLLDGKISNYSKWCTSLLGSPELFFNSVFCSQASRRISDMTTGELKRLFSEFLKLERLEQFEGTSKQCNNLLTSRASSLEQNIESLKILIEGYSEADIVLSHSHAEKKALELRLVETSHDLEKSEAELATVQSDIQKNELIKTELAGLQEAQDRLSDEIESDKKQYESEITDLRIKHQGIKVDMSSVESLLANKDKIEQAAATRLKLTDAMSKDVALSRELIREHFAAISAASKAETAANEASLRQKRKTDLAKNDITILELKLKHMKLKEAELGKRDPECVSKTCSFILSALSAQQDIPILANTINEQTDNAAVLKKEYSGILESFTADIEALRSKESAQKAKKDEIEARINHIEDDLGKVKTLADELPKIETALSREQDLGKRLSENVVDGKKLKASWEKRIADKKAQIIKTETTMDEIEDRINTGVEAKVGGIQQDISNFKAAITKLTDEIADKIADIVRRGQDVTRKEQAQKKLTNKTAEKELVVNEASEWSYLKHACSAKGLRALEIDSVLPAIAAYANDLLIGTFGTQYTVRFQTQNEETGREILDIIIIREDGSEVLIESLSGGERVWILSALRLSLTLISQEKSGKIFQTGFADESDGALDIGHAIEYVQMYRAFMEVGGFENFYFISHKPETIALSDHVLNFSKGGVILDG